MMLALGWRSRLQSWGLVDGLGSGGFTAPRRVPPAADGVDGGRGDIVRLLLFAFPMFFVAALLESFVRRSALGEVARYWVAAGSALLWLAYFGLTRLPRRMLLRVSQPEGLLDRAVPLPDREEILDVLEHGAGGRGQW